MPQLSQTERETQALSRLTLGRDMCLLSPVSSGTPTQTHPEITFTNYLGTLGPRQKTDHHSASGAHLSRTSPCLSVSQACLWVLGSMATGQIEICWRGDTEGLLPVWGVVLGLSSLIRWDIWRDHGVDLIRFIQLHSGWAKPTFLLSLCK